MKITFIHPPALIALGSYSTFTQPPLGIAYLAAYMRALGHEVTVVDGVGDAMTRIRRWPLRKGFFMQGLSFEEIAQKVPRDTEVLGLSSMFTHSWPMVRALVRFLKKVFPRVKVVAGGEHVTAMYDVVLRDAPVDVCVLGEGERALGDVIAAFEKGICDYSRIEGIAYRGEAGRIVKTPARKRIEDLDGLPWPAWDLLDPMVYLNGELYVGPCAGMTIPMLASRGCPYQCTFCSAPMMWAGVWRARDPAKVVDEMVYYARTYGAMDFQLMDLSLLMRRDWTIAFCNEIINRKLKITWQLPVGTRAEAVDAEVVRLLAASGCCYIQYAPESGSRRILDAVRKPMDLRGLERSTNASVKAGLRVCALFVLGFPQETKEDIAKTLRLVRRIARMGVDEAAVSAFVPLPGTELHQQIDRVRPITRDDEFCYLMAGSTSLFSARSWNPRFSDRALTLIRLWALTQFYALLYYHHPGKLLRVVRNLILRQQEIKVDRVLIEAIKKSLIALGLPGFCLHFPPLHSQHGLGRKHFVSKS